MARQSVSQLGMLRMPHYIMTPAMPYMEAEAFIKRIYVSALPIRLRSPHPIQKPYGILGHLCVAL